VSLEFTANMTSEELIFADTKLKQYSIFTVSCHLVYITSSSEYFNLFSGSSSEKGLVQCPVRSSEVPWVHRILVILTVLSLLCEVPFSRFLLLRPFRETVSHVSFQRALELHSPIFVYYPLLSQCVSTACTRILMVIPWLPTATKIVRMTFIHAAQNYL